MGADGLEWDYPGKVRTAVARQRALGRAEVDKQAGAELLHDGAISTSA